MASSSPNPPAELHRSSSQHEDQEEEDDEEPVDNEVTFIPLPMEGAVLPSSLTGPRRRRRRGRSWLPSLAIKDEEKVEVLGFARVQTGEGGEEAGCSGAPRRMEEERSVVPTCPICMEKWTSEGLHRVCCIPCGHVYGRSCLLKWFKQCGKNNPKCPQCNKKFKQKEIVNLYAPLVAVANDDLEKEVSYLRAQNDSLVLENDCLLEEVHKHKVESEIREARVLDIDAYNQLLMISRTVPTLGSGHIITKISLFVPNEMENLLLPSNIGLVKDLHVAPFNAIHPGRLVLLASLGKKLSLFSGEGNSVVHQYDLPGPAWSCSWDVNNPYFAYAGLQDGSLLMFDIRQTARPLRSQPGPSGHPIHTIHSVASSHGPDSRKLFSASSVGTCLWDWNFAGDWPTLIPGMEGYGICIALACTKSSAGYMVASFRPKVDVLRNNTSSQRSQPCSPITGHGKVGTHVLLKQRHDHSFEQYKHSSGNVSEVRMSKSTIFAVNTNSRHIFAYGDEASRGLCIWDIPSFSIIRHLKPHQYPILDVKSSCSSSRGLLACISKSRLQVFSFSGL